jgi:hypothetical protein
MINETFWYNTSHAIKGSLIVIAQGFPFASMWKFMAV